MPAPAHPDEDTDDNLLRVVFAELCTSWGMLLLGRWTRALRHESLTAADLPRALAEPACLESTPMVATSSSTLGGSAHAIANMAGATLESKSRKLSRLRRFRAPLSDPDTDSSCYQATRPASCFDGILQMKNKNVCQSQPQVVQQVLDSAGHGQRGRAR